MNLRPSKLPMLQECPCFEPGAEQDFTTAGSVRHTLLSGLLTENPHLGFDALSKEFLAGKISEEETEGIGWAAEYIRDHAPTYEHKLHCERKLSLLDTAFNVIMVGTPDVTCGPVLFDLKWRRRDYGAQMAAYAAMMFQENAWSEVQVHVLYAESKFAQRFSFAYDDALRLVLDIVASASAPGAAPKACDYCGWCAKAVTCPALLKPALDAAAARQEPAEADKSLLVPFLDTGAHSSEIKDALTMGAALRMARVVARWCKSVEHHAREMAVKGGQVPAGFEISNRAGKMFVTDTAAAFGLAALPQEDFLKACAVRLNSSVKYKEQVGLIEVAAKFNGVKKAQAKRDLLAKLAPVVKQGDGSVQLKAVGKEEDDETEE